jgi:hypothetical protein
MYFWRIEQLKTQMAARPLTDRETLPYLVIYSALMSAAWLIPVPSLNLWDIVTAIWGIALAVFGTIYIYRQNGGDRGNHFLQRYFALGWVVAIRWVAGFIPCALAFHGVIAFTGVYSESTTWYDFLFQGSAEAVLYWRIAHHVRDLATRTTQS